LSLKERYENWKEQRLAAKEREIDAAIIREKEESIQRVNKQLKENIREERKLDLKYKQQELKHIKKVRYDNSITGRVHHRAVAAAREVPRLTHDIASSIGTVLPSPAKATRRKQYNSFAILGSSAPHRKGKKGESPNISGGSLF